ncbi:CBD9-like protein [Coniochaeta ligniaria NRRL 30616]|uniref:CBD9-like protein n=1 Tax=Coniochaeta ligniaria NRRL 30616 TaxID=1408157 RepID=A0A1J7JAJ1_9PEZI|nr:CBD9-like protein [Coniochaeta ligniaria NRRL 30616]
MASRTLLAGLMLCSFWALARADDNTTKKPVSTLYSDKLDTTFSINLPENSGDVNFFLSSPLFSWFGVGFSSTMAGSPMLLFYASADGKAVTVSPRYATGETEPAYNSTMRVAVAASTVNNGTFAVTGTCSGCRQWSSNSTTQPFILAWGADADFLSTNDLAARVKQHSGYGHFVMDVKQATGPGGTAMLLALDATKNSDGAHLDGDLQADTGNHGGLAHGVVMALATLVVAPIDVLTAGALRRWPVLNIITSTVMMAFLLAGMGLGIQMSRLYIATQQYRTAHQILGLLAIVALFLVAVLGVVYRLIVKSATKRGQQPPEKSGLLGKVHRWVGRAVWVIMLVNNGLGLQFAEASSTLIIGYAVLAAGVLILVGLIRWSIYCCTRHSREELEEDKAGIELAQLYAPSHHMGHGAGH